MVPKILFPSWRYHATLPACIVQNQNESDALGAGWADSPSPAVVDVEPAAGSFFEGLDVKADPSTVVPTIVPKKLVRKWAKSGQPSIIGE